MKTVAIIDPTSMVGSMVFQTLKERMNLVLVFRERSDIELLEKSYGGTSKHRNILFDPLDAHQDFVDGFSSTQFGPRTKKAFTDIDQVDAVVNCITVVKPHLLENLTATYFINAAWPHVLSRWFGNKLIHLSTDCVFSGVEGAPYTEDMPVSPTDLYGLTRSLSEPSDRSIVIRTSTIGLEIKNFDSLIAWVKKQDGKTIKGFTRHFWNGITTKQFALCVDRIIRDRDHFPDHGLFHVFGNDISKYELVTAIAKKYNLQVTIDHEESSCLDRRLSTVEDLQSQLVIPAFSQQLHDL